VGVKTITRYPEPSNPELIFRLPVTKNMKELQDLENPSLCG
jgi:hypothetical protein